MHPLCTKLYVFNTNMYYYYYNMYVSHIIYGFLLFVQFISNYSLLSSKCIIYCFIYVDQFVMKKLLTISISMFVVTVDFPKLKF